MGEKMIKCKIIECTKNDEYTIEYKQDKYTLVLEFYGIDRPKVGDRFQLNEILLDKNWENYCQPYAFEPIAISPLNVKDLKNNDLIVLETEDNICTLKRIYG